MTYSSDTLVYDVIVTKAIQAGDELTIDYGLIDPAIDGTSFQCSCSASACRGVITA